MKKRFVAVVIFVVQLPALALVAPDPPPTEWSRLHHYCSFMLAYELIHKAVADVQKEGAHTLPNATLETLAQLDKAHSRYCAFGCWDAPTCKERCMKRAYNCRFYGFFNSTPIKQRIAVDYQECQGSFKDEVLGKSENSESWLAFLMPSRCPNLVADANQHLRALRLYLMHECETRKGPELDVASIEQDIEKARALTPTVEALATIGFGTFGVYWCMLNAFVFSVELSQCYQQRVNDYVRAQEDQLIAAKTFAQMCDYLAMPRFP